MRPGNYYCYYKPTYLNGYETQPGQDMDMEYIQTIDGACRDEFSPDEAFLSSSQFSDELSATSGLMTATTNIQLLFEQAFKRTYNIEQALNTNMKEFKRKVKYATPDDKPLLLLTCREQIMPYIVQQF